MAIDCDHPRPRLELPGYVPRRMAWQVPGTIPGVPVEAARAIQQALQGVYNELSRQGQTRNVIPLVEDLFVQPGSVVVGVGNGQTVTLLPPGATGYLDPASVVLTDVVDPVTVLYPDGTSVELGEAGSYDFTPVGTDTYETVPGSTSGTVTTSMLADDSVTNAKLANMAANTIKVNPTAATADPTDLTIPTFSILGRRGSNIETISTTEFVATGRRVFLKTGATGTPGSPLGFGNISIGDLPVMNDGQVYMNTSGVNGSAPSFKDGSSLASSGLTWTGTPTYALSITTNGVLNTMIRQGAGTSVIGRSANSTGNVADITAASDDTILARTSGALGWSPLTIGMIPDGIITIAKLAGIGANTVIGNDTASTFTPNAIAIGTNSVLGRVGGNIVAAQLVTAQITDANITDAKISNRAALSVFGRSANSTGVGADIATSADGDVLRRSGTTLGFGTIATAGLADDSVTDAKLRNSGALSVIGRSANSTGDPADISAAAASGAVLRESGSALSFGTIATAGITDAAVTNAKLANMASPRLKGRTTASTGVPEDLTLTNSTSITWNTSTGGAISVERAALTGEVTAAANANATTITRTTNFTWTGTHSFGSQFILGSQQNESGTLPLANTLLDTTNRLYILIAGDGNITSITPAGGTNTIGRVVEVYIVGSGTKTVKHNAAPGIGNILCPENADFTITNRGSFTLIGDGATNGWLAFHTPSLPTASVTDAKISNRTALSVFGRSANSSGVGADIAAVAAAGSVLRESGSTIGFGTIATAGITDAAVTLAKLANIAAGTAIGRQIDASTGVPVALTGAEQGENFRVNTRQTVSASGTLDIVLNDDTTILVLQLTADATLRSLSNTATGDGRYIRVEHDTGAFTLTLGHNLATPTYFPLFNPNAADMQMQRGGTLTIRARSGFWRPEYPGAQMRVRKNSTGTVFNRGRLNLIEGTGHTLTVADDTTNDEVDITIALTDMAAATLKGRALGAGTGAPTDITQTQLSDMFRIISGVTDTPAPGTFNDYAVADTTKLLRINPSSSGDVNITGFAMPGGNTGGWFRLFNQGASGVERIVLKHADAGSSANNQLVLPESTDFILDRFGDCVDMQFIGGRWQVVSQQINTQRITANAVTDAKLRQSAGLSVIGRSANSTGNVADITAVTDGHVLRLSGTTLGFGTIATAGITDAAVTLAKLANLAQSTIIGRAEGAGTGVPTALTATQVASIIDQENITWTGTASFTGSTFTVNTSGATSITSNFTTLTSTGATVVSAGSGVLTLAASTTIDLNSPHRSNSSLHLTGILSSTETGPVDNKSIGSVGVWRLTAGASPVLLRGMVAGGAGHFVWVFNLDTVNSIQVQPEDTSSTAANRFSLSGTSFSIGPLRGFPFWYDGTSSRWRPAALY